MYNKDLTREQLIEKISALQERIDSLEKTVEAQRHTEVALSTSEKNLSAILEKNADGIVIVDSNGTVLYVNPAAEKLFGRSKEDFLGYPFGFPVSANEVEDSLVIRKGDTLCEAELRVVQVQWQKGNAFQLSVRDITERKRGEVELIRAKERAEESDRLKTAFLHNISHEIRTPMNAIVGFSSFLNDPGLAPEKRKYYTEIIIQSSDQLLAIITDLVSIATIEAGQGKICETEVNLNSTLKLLYEQYILKAQKQYVLLRFNSVLSDFEANISTDETKLTEILSNLIGNALKFTKNGYITYGYKIVEAQHAAPLLEFYIEDSGIGIPPEMHDEIFQRFRQVEMTATRQFGGSGLGLSISKAYVELFGGKIWLSSEQGKGSTFYFTIPYKKVTRNDIPKKQIKNGLNIEIEKAITLLIAEDEDSNFLLLEEFLSGADLNIIRAINGIEAVEICKSNPQIDLVLMDIKMPEMNGYEATKQIKAFRPNLPVIAQTAYITDLDKSKAFAFGCNGFIAKPIERNLLLAKIQEQLAV